jgi:hypothetical protein
LAVVAVATVVAFRLIGRIDWAAVWDAVQYLAWWQAPVLAALLVVRQLLNSLPLALYIAGMSPYRAFLNDQVAVLIGTVAPPPSDLALRTAMFSSWRVPIAQGVAGVGLHKLTFYVVRYATPIVGLAILLVRGDELGIRLFDLASIALSIGIAVVLLLVMRSDALAAGVGRRGGRLVRRLRAVDPEAWAASCVRFREDVAARFRPGFPWALAALTGMLTVSGLILVLCLRFVGVSAAEVPVSVIVAAYAIGFPLTVFPFNGIGLLDAAVVAGIVAHGGGALEAPAVAAMIVWRAFVLGGPMALGAGSVLWWHHRHASQTALWQLVRGRGESPSR